MKPRLIALALPVLFLVCLGFLRAEPTAKLRDPNIPLAPGEVPDAKPAPARTALPDAYAPITDDPKLSRVLLLGDSVSIGYATFVRKELAGVANVHRVPANCGATTTALGDYGLSRWIKKGEKWDVIVFNHGLHDASYRFADGTDKDKDGHYASPARGCRPYVSVGDYAKNLHLIVDILSQTGTKLIFATTTPIPKSLAEKYVENSELPYNEAAQKVMKERGVVVVDLWAAVKPVQAKLQIPRNVHFTSAGSSALAKPVARSIALALAPPAAVPVRP